MKLIGKVTVYIIILIIGIVIVEQINFDNFKVAYFMLGSLMSITWDLINYDKWLKGE